MRIFDRRTVSEFEIGSSLEETPEGFLLCRNVPISRTGTQQYLAEELPDLEPGRDGIIHVDRSDGDVFLESSIASFVGKDVTGDEDNEHPEAPVCPDTYKEVTVGVILNPRRGEGPQSDLLIADLLIKDAGAIAAVRAGKRQISCGYDADYEQIEPGRARQLNIIGNHVALVKRGRCGTRCSIGDEEMAPAKKPWIDRLMAAWHTGDEEMVKKVAEEKANDEAAGTGGDVHIHVGGGPNGATVEKPKPAAAVTSEDEDEGMEEDEDMPPYFKKFSDGFGTWQKKVNDKLFGEKTDDEDEPDEEEEAAELQEEEGEDESEGDVLDEDPDEEEMSKNKKKPTGDSAKKLLFREVVAGAEILAPGIKLPTFDSKLAGPDTVKAMDMLKRRALTIHAKTKDGARALRTLTGSKTLNLKDMKAAGVGVLFNGAVGMAKDRNNRRTIDLDGADDRRNTTLSAPQSITEFNANKNSFWAKQGQKH